MNPRRSLTVMLAAATLLMGCGGGGGGQSPEQVATKWRLAYAKGDFETTVDLEAPELHAQNGRAAAIAFEKSLYKPPTPDHQVVAVKAVRTVKDSTDQKNQYVFVYLQVTERDYPAEQETVTLRKVSGAWRVAKWQP